MKEAITQLFTNIADIFKVKSLITLTLTGVLVAMLVGAFNPSQEFVTLFCTAYGSIITYFFTKQNDTKTDPVKEEAVVVDEGDIGK